MQQPIFVPSEPLTVESLASQVEELRKLLLNAARLHRKDVLRRYGISKSTLHRRLTRGQFPRPTIRFVGPVWTLGDLEAAERAGQLPRPVSA